MAIDPIGENAYKNLAVPLYGESAIRQQNSSNAILTLMHSTANTGRLLMGMNYMPEGSESSLLQDLAAFDIDAEGGFRAVSGTTIKMELNSSGLFAGAYQVLDSSGGTLGKIPTYTTMTTGANYSPTTAQSGTLFALEGLSNGTSLRVLLPKNPSAGVWFDFFVSTQDEAGDFAINCTANSSAQIIMPGVTSAVSTASAISPLTTLGAHYIRLTAASSVTWLAQCAPGFGAAVTTNLSEADLNQGHWGAGTTSA